MPGTSSPKIIIVGAGASGIAAATRLLQNGISDILVLEAENRIGGRINSVEFGGSIVDLGAQWCHGEDGNGVYQIVKDLNVLRESYNDYSDNTFYLSDGTIVDKAITDRLSALAKDVMDDEKAAKNHKGPTFGDYFVEKYKESVNKEFGGNKEGQAIANIMLDWFHKFFLCLDASKTWYDVSPAGPFKYVECPGDPQWNWWDRGFKTVLDVMMKKFPDITNQLPIDDKIFLNKEVNRIVWDDNTVNSGGVTVDCADGSSYNADHVIITVSLGVLKNLYRNFFPELPPFKQNAIEAMYIGTVNKILLKFPTKWWSNDLKGFSLVWTEDDRRNVAREFPHGPVDEDGRSWLEAVFGFYVIDSHPRVLLGWVVGKMADQVELLSDEVVTEGCMYLLKRYAGGSYDVPQPDEILRSKWKTNPHFCGSYSTVSLEAERRNASAEDLAQPLVSSNSRQTVLFAGEATHSTFFSSVHGAIESGYREADRIINIYGWKERFHKVVIVGAGMAGLGAARTLSEMGFNDFVILEAQEKPGGRIRSVKWENHRLELGAQWMHGTQNPLFDIAKKHGLISNTTTDEGAGLYIRDNGEVVPDAIVHEVATVVENIMRDCEQFVDAPKYPMSVSHYLREKFQQYLRDSPASQSETVREQKLELLDWHFRFFVIDNSCSDLKKLSAKHWGAYQCTDDVARINLRGGYDELVRVVIGELPHRNIRLCSPVSEIDYTGNRIKVTCHDGSTINCDHVILTPSLGILKDKQHLKIHPELPAEVTKAIHDAGYYGIGKIFLIFDRRWWKDTKGYQILWRRNVVLKGEERWTRDITGFDPIPGDPNVLLAWVGGEGLSTMEQLSEEEVGVHCVGVLRRILPNQDVPKPIKVVRTRWLSNPWIRGGYSHISTSRDDSDSGIVALSRPVFWDKKLRVLLAGEAIHPSHYSTAHGAFESGQRQATVLCEYMKRTSKL